MFLPEDVKVIIDTLYAHGHEAYAVGGCVRDMILKREPGDWDITTSAKPEETKELFEKTFDTGIEHGTITVLLNGVGYEVTTYRIDGSYEDSRHPSEVEFTRNLTEDLKRRDFTINAMAYNDKEGLVDIFEGAQDLERKIIRCVGNAEERFGEDALRILRAIRFSAQLGFEIEDETKRGIQNLAHTLVHISAERIQVEMVKLLVSSNPDFINIAYELGVTKVIFPEWDKGMKEGVGPQILKALKLIEEDKMLRIAILLYGTDEGSAKAILRRLKFDNETIKVVSRLVRFANAPITLDKRSTRYAMYEIGTDLFEWHLQVQCAMIQAKQENDRTEAVKEALEQLEVMESLYREVIEKQQCTSLKQLAVTGNDLIACGVKQGKEIGEVLHKLLLLVLDEPEYNEVEYLREKAREMIQ